jgi:Na+/melibiose symporter-like transporter
MNENKHEEGKMRKEKPDKIGVGKFWAWLTRSVSAAINFIILSYITIYCTDALKMPAALVGTLLMVSKIVDGITDLFAGYIVDKTKSKFGKGRPYEFAILGAWLCTWLLYSVPENASLVIKCIWVVSMYTCVQSICVTLLSACQNPYMIRAFKTNGQRVKIASLGGLVVMFASIAVSIAFPILMNRIAVSPAGWSRLVTMLALPLGLLGMLRFVFVKETIQVEETKERVLLKDVVTLLKHNPYIYMVAFNWLIYSLVTGMGIAQFFYSYVVGNIELMGMTGAFAMLGLPLMFFFPLIMKKVPTGKMVQIGCLANIVSSALLFVAGGNITVIIIAVIIGGAGVLPITCFTDLMMLDCGSYNTWKGRKRMDGTIGAIKGFSGKVGMGLGSGLLGILLGLSGYDGMLAT